MTLKEHIDLLQEKGYLEQNFKSGHQLGYWLRELEEHYEQCRTAAILSNQPQRFFMETLGRFNNGLDLLFVTFRYQYFPDSEDLQLQAVSARLRNRSKPYLLSRSSDLVPAVDVHAILDKASVLNNRKDLYSNLKSEFRRDRDPENDYDPQAPLEKPYRDRLSEDYRLSPSDPTANTNWIGPSKDELPPELRQRLHR